MFFTLKKSVYRCARTHYFISGDFKGFNSTVENRALPSLHEGSLEITLTVYLRTSIKLFLLKND